jgi:hypothetical protein
VEDNGAIGSIASAVLTALQQADKRTATNEVKRLGRVGPAPIAQFNINGYTYCMARSKYHLFDSKRSCKTITTGR